MKVSENCTKYSELVKYSSTFLGYSVQFSGMMSFPVMKCFDSVEVVFATILKKNQLINFRYFQIYTYIWINLKRLPESRKQYQPIPITMIIFIEGIFSVYTMSFETPFEPSLNFTA